MAKKLTVEIWSDVACPWCYVGKRRLEAALALFPERDAVEIVWRSFQLDPAAPSVYPPSPSYVERLAKKFGRPVSHVEQMLAQMTELARSEGLPFDFARIQGSNTFDAHRLIHLAHELGRGDAMKERLFAAHFCEGKAVGDHATLQKLAEDVGLDVDRVQALLASDLHADGVRADIAEARALGVTGVPFFLFARRYAVGGAQPKEVLLEALKRAYADLPEELGVSEGAVCGPDGCV